MDAPTQSPPSKGDAIDDFIALPKDQQLSTLQTLAPDKQDALLSKVKERRGGATPTPPPAIQASQPGFLQRFGQAVGIPTSEEEMKQAAAPAIDIPNHPILSRVASGIAGPAAVAGKMIGGYGKNILQAGKDFLTAPTSSTGDFAKDFTNVNSSPQAVHLASAIAAPVGGQVLESGAKDIDEGNLPAMGGDFLGTLANLALLHAERGPSAEKATNKLAFAAGPGEFEHISKTLGDLHNASEGKPIHTVDDFLSTVKKAKDSMNNESGGAMAQIAARPTVPMAIGQKIRDLITPNMDMTEAGRAAKQQIENAAIEFEKPGWTLGKLDAERMQRNADLASVYKKSPLAKYTAEKGNINYAIDNAVSNAIRDHVYPEMDVAAGKPSGYFADLKRRQGALINLEDTLTDRVKDLEDEHARVQGAPRLSQSQINSTAVGHTGMAKTALNVLHKPNALATADAAAKAGLATGSPVARAVVGSLPARYLTLLPSGHPLALSHPPLQ